MVADVVVAIVVAIVVFVDFVVVVYIKRKNRYTYKGLELNITDFNFLLFLMFVPKKSLSLLYSSRLLA